MRTAAALLFACAICVATWSGAAAESWPTRPIRAIVPFAPGTGADVVSRLIFNQLSTYASAGVGSTTHLTAERFRLSAGFEAVHVPFRGGGFRPEVASGRIDFGFSPIAVAIPDIHDGRLIALGVSGKQRASALRDVPTTLEAGYPNSDYSLWMGVFVPVKTSRAIVNHLHDEVEKALNEPALRARLANLDVDPMKMTPAEFDAYVREEIVTEGALAKAAGLKPN